MKKTDLVNAICEMQSNIPRTLLSKKDFSKANLEALYRRLVNGEDYKDLLEHNLSRKKSGNTRIDSTSTNLQCIFTRFGYIHLSSNLRTRWISNDDITPPTF